MNIFQDIDKVSKITHDNAYQENIISSRYYENDKKGWNIIPSNQGLSSSVENLKRIMIDRLKIMESESCDRQYSGREIIFKMV